MVKAPGQPKFSDWSRQRVIVDDDEGQPVSVDALYLRGYEAGRRYKRNRFEWRAFLIGSFGGAMAGWFLKGIVS